MGNEASVEIEQDFLEQPVSVQVQRKPTGDQAKARKILESYYTRFDKDKLRDIDRIIDKYNGNYSGMYEALEKKYGKLDDNNLSTVQETNNGNTVNADETPVRKKSITITVPVEEEVDDDDVSPIHLLLQFIPYYGQGDPSNDSTVRAALSSLAIDEIDSRDDYGNTLLLLACQYRCEDLVRIMLNKGADPNAINSSGACCLHFACYRESASFTIAKNLLQNGANPEIRETSYGCTPLHYCAGTGDIDFCKLLLSHGAQVNSVDFYNYTCVDYAQEAGMKELAVFLRGKLAKAKESSKRSSNNLLNLVKHEQYSSSPVQNSYSNYNTTGTLRCHGDDWYPQVDPASGGKYYINNRTQETLWESQLIARMQSFPQSPSPVALESNKQNISIKVVSTPNSNFELSTKSAPTDLSFLISQTAKARLISFLSKQDPTQLGDVDSLIEKYNGKEQELLMELCTKYGVDPQTEIVTFKEKLNELKLEKQAMNPVASPMRVKSMSNADFEEVKSPMNSVKMHSGEAPSISNISAGGGAIVNGIDPAVVQDLLNEARIKFESERDEERQQQRLVISEKDGAIVKLESQLQAARKDKEELSQQFSTIQSRLERMQSIGGETQAKSEATISNLENENLNLRNQVESLKQSLSIELNKLKSLEDSLTNLTSGHEEQVSREKKAAEERALQQREREEKHANELRELENKIKETENKLKSEFNKASLDWAKQENELLAAQEQFRRMKEIEIETMNDNIADFKSKISKELSETKMLAEDYRKSSEESTKRADDAENIVRQMQQEIMEARQIQAYNDRLHKDLAREQLLRKKLHNEMEDMKGRIRVYVRVRPLSNSERERNCTEAVVKDGKLSVVLKMQDGKKTYDFDQVFGGVDGNTQTDIFRDTKHLIMSVVDGYNVCIFAYGQTGAGKSFTMIGAADIGDCLGENGEFDDLAGITPRAVSELFRLLNERAAQVEYQVEVQMFQLYRDGLDDLCFERKKKGKGVEEEYPPELKIVLAEHSSSGLVEVQGATVNIATTPADVMKIFGRAAARRTTASTQMNAESSRSHLICSLVVRLKNRRTGKESVGKLTLVDLAGSERLDKSGAQGEMMKEAQSINKSLSAIGDVIAALTSGQNHIPYRNHPLTMLMSDSIGGNAKTLMFVNTSPADYNLQESDSSLKFASRCKDITNAVSASGGVQTAQMNALKKELAKLKKGGKAGGKNLSIPVNL